MSGMPHRHDAILKPYLLAMNHTIEYIGEKHYFLVNTFGELTGSGYVAIFRDLFDTQEWEKGHPILVDHRNASVKEMSLTEIENFSAYLKKKNIFFGHSKMAIIMPPKGELSKYAMWKIMLESEVLFSIDIFASIEEAEEWFSQSSR